MVIDLFHSVNKCECESECGKKSENLRSRSHSHSRSFFVELAGVEPASKHGSHTLSTCLVLLDFRDLSAAEQPNLPLFPVCFAIGSEQPSD